MEKRLHLGTAGWSYKDWLGPFYPKGTKPRDYLSYFSSKFDSVEIDSTFYAVPEEHIIQRWKECAGSDFLFCPKFPQIITHEKRLTDCALELDLYLGRIQKLGGKLGPQVLQFDYRFTPKYLPALGDFLAQLPSDYQYAVEIRNRNWLGLNEFFELLEYHHCALVMQDIYYMPRFFKLTAPFTYIRLLGDRRAVPDDFSHVRIDRERELSDWAGRIVQMLEEGIEVYTYVNNRYQGHAPATALNLKKKIESLSYQ